MTPRKQGTTNKSGKQLVTIVDKDGKRLRRVAEGQHSPNTYMPGKMLVPCAQCGKEIDRRGRGRGHKKFCDGVCKRAFVVAHQKPRRVASTVCTKCKVNPPRKKAGRGNKWCLPCESAYRKELYARPEVKERMRQRNQRPDIKQQKREYRKQRWAALEPEEREATLARLRGIPKAAKAKGKS